MKNDNKLIDRIFGIGKIRSDIHTSVDGKKFTEIEMETRFTAL